MTRRSRRRGKRGRTSPDPPAKRRRGPLESEYDDVEAAPAPAPAPQPSSVMVAGLPPGCGVMELKSRLEAYGPIARTRIDAAAATGHVTFRSAAAAAAAIAASLDPECGITIGSKKVLVVQASEVPNDQKTVVQSDPTDATKNGVGDASAILSRLGPRAIHKSREIVAYDDLF
ncbi:uncharacterized protein At1g27050 [Lolium perenne]|uniref:uncharacterized protein At1g27050 n=1 Tax=Lolium perenne TaxID=4522 RepID=UPI0021E9FC90|nr:uncharacterized protein At1g27050 [Lolium perenne]XP_051226194.1 uncharacterized protein At1g27050 [Lolium perenne]XP_051226195.1 uncharacterized protein At1g27050 [Lolium perenne]